MNRLAHHLISFYGEPVFSRLIQDFRIGTSSSIIAEYTHVSRQRIHQWKNALGYETKIWSPHIDVLAMVKNGDSGTKNESQEADREKTG